MTNPNSAVQTSTAQRVLAETLLFFLWPVVALIAWKSPETDVAPWRTQFKVFFWIGVASAVTLLVGLFTGPSIALLLGGIAGYLLGYLVSRLLIARIF